MEQQISSEDRSAIDAIVSQTLNDLSQLSATAANYENSASSASAAVGTEGGGMKGWITYTRSGAKIHFEAGRIASFFGLFAGGGGLPLVGALRLEYLAGKTGTFTAAGVAGGGALQMWVEGQPVFTDPIPLVGVGAPFTRWELKGDVRFVRAA